MRQGDDQNWLSLSVVLAASLVFASTVATFFSINSVAEEGEPRKVTLELITATWCATCPYADEAADELSREYGPERFSVLQYHVSLDGLDTTETNERRDDYNAGQTGLPAAWFDGIEGVHSVGEPDTEFFHGLYKDKIDKRLKIDSPISISATMTELSDEIIVSVSFGKAKNIVPPDDIHARYVLFENAVQYQGPIYNYVVRDVEIKDFDYDALPYDEQVSFGVQGGWQVSNMGVAVFVHADTIGEVLQSATAVLGPKPTVTIVTDLDGKEISEVTRIEGTAIGNVQWIEYRIDDQVYKTADGTNSWHFDLNPSKLSSGKHTLSVRAYSSSLIYSNLAEAEFETRSDIIWYFIILMVIIVIVLILVMLVRRKGKE